MNKTCKRMVAISLASILLAPMTNPYEPISITISAASNTGYFDGDAVTDEAEYPDTLSAKKRSLDDTEFYSWNGKTINLSGVDDSITWLEKEISLTSGSAIKKTSTTKAYKDGSYSIVLNKTQKISIPNEWNGIAHGVAYYSVNEDIATVNSSGIITGISEGTTQIVAVPTWTLSTDDDVYFSGFGLKPRYYDVTIKGSNFTNINSSVTNLYIGRSSTISGIENYYTLEGFSIESSNPTVATVTNYGTVTGVSAGTAYIILHAKGYEDTKIQVVVKPTPSTIPTVKTIPITESYQIPITKDMENNGVIYYVYDTDIIEITEENIIKPLKQGKTTVVIESEGYASIFMAVTVTKGAMKVNIPKKTILAGETVQCSGVTNEMLKDNFTATSSNEAVAYLDPNTGILKGVSEGYATITLSCDNYEDYSFNVYVTKVTNTAYLDKLDFYPTQKRTIGFIKSSDRTESTYKTSDPDVATISSTGIITAVNDGTCSLTVSKPYAKDITFTINVESKTLTSDIVKLKKSTIKTGASTKFTYPVKYKGKLTFESDDTDVATVTKYGKVNGKSEGDCYIYVYLNGYITKRFKVEVVPK